MSERLKPQVKTIVTLTPRHGEDHPSSPALSRRPPLVIIHPDAQQAVAELMQDMALTFQQCGSLENVEGFRATT